MMLYILASVGLFIICTNAAYEGESCFVEDTPATCVNLRNCRSALNDIKNRKNPQICSFEGMDPIVCCKDRMKTTPAPTQWRPSRPVLTTTTQRTTTTTVYVPPYYDYKNSEDTETECEPLSPTMTAKKTGQKAWDKCIEYQEQLVYPCVIGVTLTGGASRANRCNHNADELIINGVDAHRGEFPHMVLLGFGADPETAQWLCGGTLISEKFILTAGHCTSSRDFGPISYGILGTLTRHDKVDSSRLYKIARIIKHPEYKPPSKYNDIALLETERVMQLDQYAVPACLHTGEVVKDSRASATGWGVTQFRGSSGADVLQKVTLSKFTAEECILKFPPTRLMKQGFRDHTQLCYGDKTESKDTCQGDSGGPIQIKNSKIHCMYTVIGVTSFGKACGYVGEPGIYTRVAAYIPWIESIVWP